jgi:hypothetical protein
MITVSYEMLKTNPATELQKICDFSGLKRERTWLEFWLGIRLSWLCGTKRGSLAGRIRLGQKIRPWYVGEKLVRLETKSAPALKRMGYL